MVPIALTDPMWWVARRLRQFLTSLAMLALAFGAGSAHASPVGPPAILDARPATLVTFEFGAAPVAEFGATPATASIGSPAAEVDLPAAGDGSAAEGFPAHPVTGPLAAEQPRPAPGETTAARPAPAIGGSTPPVGQRAPPPLR